MLQESHRHMFRTHGTMIGRMLLGLLFLFSGIGMIMMLVGDEGLSGTITYYSSLGLPLAGLLVYLVILFKVVAGGALILGIKTDYAALALIVFTVLTILLAHLSLEDINLFKNLAIIGGLLYVLAYGPGEGWSLKTKTTEAPLMDMERNDPTPTL